jgi:hypothetical protein
MCRLSLAHAEAVERHGLMLAVLVKTQILAGLLLLVAVWAIARIPAGRSLVGFALVTGLALRLVMMPSASLMETDYYRYLWDGAVVAHGWNPYQYAPAEITGGTEDASLQLQRLTGQGAGILAEVNHPHLRTIYPPVAQMAFAAAFLLKPWSILGLRVVYVLFDVALLALIILALRQVGLSPLWALVYWWNPLVLREIVHNAHMDIVPTCFAFGAALLASKQRYWTAAILLGIAVGAKLWPVVLLPVLLAPLRREPTQLAIACGLFALTSAAILYPVYATGLGDQSGFTAYGRLWEMNDLIFMLLLWAVQWTLSWLPAGVGSAQLVTRALAGIALLGIVAWLSFRPLTGTRDLWERILMAVTALFLLSPTQFPWYYVWVVPFLAVRPRGSLLLLGVLLPIYYFRFMFKRFDCVWMFDTLVVWIEYVPPLGLLFWEWLRARRGRSAYLDAGFGND